MLFLVLAFVPMLDAQACTVRWKSPEELKIEAESVVRAQIISKRFVGSSFRGNDYKYRILIETSEKGSLKRGEIWVTFEDLKIHRRGEVTVCPLKHGSKIEHNLKPNQLYRLYLRSTDNLEILLAEPLTQKIKEKDKGQA